MAAWSMALETGAILHKEVNIPYVEGAANVGEASRLIVRSETEKCPLFLGKVINSVTIKPSPKWMQELLMAAGMKSINNVVDISNIVMLETGQPLHFYDLDAIPAQEITVKDQQRFDYTALDGESYHIEEDDIVITTEGKPIGIAGIMGGDDSKIEETTKGKMCIRDRYGESWEKYANNGYYSNDRMREYLYTGVYNSSIPKFDNSAASNFPEKFEGKTFYMKTYCSDGKKLSFVYANEKSTMNNGDWEASMIFNVEDGHWYDVTELNGNKIIPLKILGELVDGKEPENELLKWEAFKKKYFIPERCVD